MSAKHRAYHGSVPDLPVIVSFRWISICQRSVSQYTGSLGYRPDFGDCLFDFIQKQQNPYPVHNSRVGAVTVLSVSIAGENLIL